MADLDPRTARRTIEQAIVDQLSLAYQVRQPAVATVSALRAVTSASLPENVLRYCTASGKCFRWNRFSSSADDGASVIKPTDLDSSKPGRWLITTSTVTSGYAKGVRLYNGEGSDEAALDKLISSRPLFLVVFQKAENQNQSTFPGILYRYLCTFDIWALSSCLRPGVEGLEGSNVSAEASADPGVIAMIGDIKLSLAGSNLSITGVEFTVLGDEAEIANNQGQRTFIEKVTVTVHSTVQYPSTNDTTVGSFDINYRLAETPDGETATFASDYLTSGYTIPLGNGFTKTPASGTAYVGTTLVSSSPSAHTFSANKWTYRDLATDGTFTYSEIDPGFAEPSQANGTLRVGVTATDASGVALDRILCDSLIDYSLDNIVS